MSILHLFLRLLPSIPLNDTLKEVNLIIVRTVCYGNNLLVCFKQEITNYKYIADRLIVKAVVIDMEWKFFFWWGAYLIQWHGAKLKLCFSFLFFCFLDVFQCLHKSMSHILLLNTKLIILISKDITGRRRLTTTIGYDRQVLQRSGRKSTCN